jgi:hypothetical protein
MDRDSSYIALSGKSLDALVKPELRSEYFTVKCQWMPTAVYEFHLNDCGNQNNIPKVVTPKVL